MSTEAHLSTRLYRLLQQHPEWTPEDHAEALDVGPGEAKDAAGELLSLGLVRTDEHGWIATDPMLAIESVLLNGATRVEAWAQEAQTVAEQVQAMVSALPALRAAVDDAAVNTVLEGNESARAFLADLAASVRREILAIHTGGALSPEAIAAALPEDLQMLERGVAVRTIFLRSATRSASTRAYLERLSEAGAQVRLRETLPFRMVLADSSTAVCSMRWAEGRAGAVVVRGGAFLALLGRAFEFCWNEASPLDAVESPPCAGRLPLDQEQSLILRLLADGMTDQAIARQLGVAPRTFTRKLRLLFDAIEVETRFEAGVAAARHDLL